MHLAEFALLVVATIAAVAAGLAVVASNFRIARGLFWLAALSFGSMGVVWAVNSDASLTKQMVVAAIVAAIAAAGLVYGLWELRLKKGAGASGETHSGAALDPKATGKNSPPMSAGRDINIGHLGDVIHVPANAPLQAAQIAEIQKLSDFIGGKDEVSLRRIFDFPDMVKFNIRLGIRSIKPSLVGAAQGKEVDDYFAGGNAHLDVRFNQVTRTADGQINTNFLPGVFGIVNTSKKFAEQKSQLMAFENSPSLPIAVRTAIKEMEKALNENVIQFLFVVNQRWRENQRKVLEDGDQNSKFYAATTNLYWEKFIHLKPLSDAIFNAVRQELKVDGK